MQQFETLENVTVDGCDLNMFALRKVGRVKGDLYSLNIFENPKRSFSTGMMGFS